MRSLLWTNPETIDLLEQDLNKGGVVLAEGDTVLGLLANVSEEGVSQLDQIKNRDKKPYLVLVHDYKKALNLIQIPQEKLFQIEKLMNGCWPGPVTLIFYKKHECPSYVGHPNGTIAIRVPSHSGLLKLLERFDALFSTSANTSGTPTPNAIDQVDEGIMRSVGCIILNDEQDKNGQLTLPSTIIDCTGDRLKIVRLGAFSIDRLASIAGKELFEE